MTQTNFQIRLPDNIEHLPINEEYFFLTQNGRERRLKLHDYGDVYSIPGLYEYIANEKLHYRSPEVMSALLVETVAEAGLSVDKLKVLELGAGSGLFGKALAKQGVTSIIGIDIVPEAAIAATRECPGVYEHYYVEDLTKSSPTRSKLSEQGLNCFVCCSALSAGHIPVEAFAAGFNEIEPQGWVMFNIAKTSYDEQSDRNCPEFVRFYRQAIAQGILELCYTRPYTHRRFFNGQTLEYVAVVGRKKGEISST